MTIAPPGTGGPHRSPHTPPAARALLSAACRLLALCAALLAPLPVPAQESSATDPLADGLTVAFVEVLPPQVMPDPSGRFAGVRIDQWRLWSQETGIAVDFLHLPFADLRDAMTSGKADVADLMTPGPMTESWLSFSPQFAHFSFAIFHLTTLPSIGSIDDLQGRTVGAVAGGTCEQTLLGAGISVRTFPDLRALGEAATVGDPQLYCMSTGLGDDLFARLQLGDRYIHTAPIIDMDAHWAVLRGQDATYATVAQGFDLIPQEDLTTLNERWSGDALTSLLGLSSTDILRLIQILALMVAVGIATAVILRLRLGRALAARAAVADALRQRIREQACLHDVFLATEDMTRPHAAILSDMAVALARGCGLPGQSRYRIRLFDTVHDDIPSGLAPILTIPVLIEGRAEGEIALACVGGSIDPGPEARLLIELSASRLAGRALGALSLDRLAQSEERFRHTFQHSAQATCVIQDGIFAEANTAALTLLGYSDWPGFVGLPPAQISPEFQPDGQRSTEKAALKIAEALDHGSAKFDWEHLRADGTPVLVEVLLTAVADGDRIDVFTLWNDITIKRQAEAALAEYQRTLEDQVAARTAELTALNAELAAILATADSGIALVRNRTIVSANPSLSRILLWPEAQLTGLSTRALFRSDEEWNDGVADAYAMIGAGHTYAIQREILRGDGTTFWADIRARAINPADPARGIVWVIDDISFDRDATRKLAEARDIAEQAARLKSEFLAHMSHELRSPLNAILGFTELLLATPLTTHQNDHLRKVQSAGRHLLSIVNDVLDLSKVEAGKLRIEQTEFTLASVVKSAIDTVAATAAAKDLELIVEIDPKLPARLTGDPLRITQILMNYLSNALKFTHQGEIILSVAPDRGNRLRFSVTDSGIGMSAEQVRRMFQTFSQAEDSTARLYGGTGLGLSICRQLASLMGGEVGVESTPGQGSTFWASLPLDAVKARAPRRTALRHRRLLIVDDHPRAARAIATPLSTHGAETATAATPADAVSTARMAQEAGTPFHAILIDRAMPDADGIATARALRAALGVAAPPMILMSRRGGQQVVEEAFREGFADVITKPAETELLIDRVTAVLHGRPGPQPSSTPATPMKTDPLPPQPAPTPDLPFTGHRALVVDDNPMNSEIAAAQLARQGLTVRTAANGAEALALAEAEDFDLILMDSQMPVMGGIEATQRIRALPGGKGRLAIIGLSGNAEDDDRAAGLAAGMDDYLVKPVTSAALRGILSRWLAAAFPR
jgi:two-component system sensor histidine kinase/response regulator